MTGSSEVWLQNDRAHNECGNLKVGLENWDGALCEWMEVGDGGGAWHGHDIREARGGVVGERWVGRWGLGS